MIPKVADDHNSQSGRSKYFDRDWNCYFVALLLGDELRALQPDVFPTTSDQFVELVRRGQQANEIRDQDPLLAGILCHGMLLRVARGLAFGKVTHPLAQFTDDVTESCWRILEK